MTNETVTKNIRAQLRNNNEVSFKNKDSYSSSYSQRFSLLTRRLL